MERQVSPRTAQGQTWESPVQMGQEVLGHVLYLRSPICKRGGTWGEGFSRMMYSRKANLANRMGTAWWEWGWWWWWWDQPSQRSHLVPTSLMWLQRWASPPSLEVKLIVEPFPPTPHTRTEFNRRRGGSHPESPFRNCSFEKAIRKTGTVSLGKLSATEGFSSKNI